MDPAIISAFLGSLATIFSAYIAVAFNKKNHRDKRMTELRVEEDIERWRIDHMTQKLAYLTSKKVSGGVVNGELKEIIDNYEDFLEDYENKINIIHEKMKALK
jgi:Uri superfamily endonuclease